MGRPGRKKHACTECQRQKLKCDSLPPCSNCNLHQKSHLCTFDPVPHFTPSTHVDGISSAESHHSGSHSSPLSSPPTSRLSKSSNSRSSRKQTLTPSKYAIVEEALILLVGKHAESARLRLEAMIQVFFQQWAWQYSIVEERMLRDTLHRLIDRTQSSTLDDEDTSKMALLLSVLLCVGVVGECGIMSFGLPTLADEMLAEAVAAAEESVKFHHIENRIIARLEAQFLPVFHDASSPEMPRTLELVQCTFIYINYCKMKGRIEELYKASGIFQSLYNLTRAASLDTDPALLDAKSGEGEREMRRRLFWHVAYQDAMISLQTLSPPDFDLETVSTQVPMKNVPPSPDVVRPSGSYCLANLMAHLARHIYPVAEYSRQGRIPSPSFVSLVDSQIQSTVYLILPPGLRSDAPTLCDDDWKDPYIARMRQVIRITICKTREALHRLAFHPLNQGLGSIETTNPSQSILLDVSMACIRAVRNYRLVSRSRGDINNVFHSTTLPSAILTIFAWLILRLQVRRRSGRGDHHPTSDFESKKEQDDIISALALISEAIELQAMTTYGPKTVRLLALFRTSLQLIRQHVFLGSNVSLSEQTSNGVSQALSKTGGRLAFTTEAAGIVHPSDWDEEAHKEDRSSPERHVDTNKVESRQHSGEFKAYRQSILTDFSAQGLLLFLHSLKDCQRVLEDHATPQSQSQPQHQQINQAPAFYSESSAPWPSLSPFLPPAGLESETQDGHVFNLSDSLSVSVPADELFISSQLSMEMGIDPPSTSTIFFNPPHSEDEARWAEALWSHLPEDFLDILQPYLPLS